MTHGARYDVVVLGEVLVEVVSDQPFRAGLDVTLGVSGDAVNAAAAAAAAGARTALLTRIADDELGDMIERRLAELGIEPALVRRVPGQQAAYFAHADPGGGREFVYLRRGSAGSTLSPHDVAAAGLEEATVVLASGVTCALSDSARASVEDAARRARTFVYDPNYRPRLTTAASAGAALRSLAPFAAVVTPAAPAETAALLGTEDALEAARALRMAGAAAAVVTRGAHEIAVVDDIGAWQVPSVPALAVVDQTGAGDSLAGTLAARLALGDALLDAVRLGSAAASLSLAGRGGTGRVASLAESREHLRDHGAEPVPVDEVVA